MKSKQKQYLSAASSACSARQYLTFTSCARVLQMLLIFTNHIPHVKITYLAHVTLASSRHPDALVLVFVIQKLPHSESAFRKVVIAVRDEIAVEHLTPFDVVSIIHTQIALVKTTPDLPVPQKVHSVLPLIVVCHMRKVNLSAYQLCVHVGTGWIALG